MLIFDITNKFMLILIICIVINALIGVAFKLFDKFKINVLQGIVVNYFTCVVTASVVYGRPAIDTTTFQEPWIWHAAFLGLLFVVAFNILGRTVAIAGVMVTTIFQKMSFIIPVLVAVLLMSDSFGYLKILGILLAIASLLLLQWPKREDVSKMKIGLLWLAITFITSAVIDTYLYLIEALEIAPNGNINFVASLFFFAGTYGSVAVLYQYFKNGISLQWKNVIGGICLGIPNFFSIYLILYLLAHNWTGSELYPLNNVGVIAVSSLFGIVIFKEGVTVLKVLGFFAAILSIIAILFA